VVELIRRRYPGDPETIRPTRTLGTPPVRTVSLGAPWRWLRLGWRDLWRAPIALLHGLVVSVLGMLMIALTWDQTWLSFNLLSGFLLVGPVLAVGVNELARRLEQDGRVGFQTGLKAIPGLGARLWYFALILAIIFTFWATFVWLWIAVLNVGEVGILGSLDQMLAAMLTTGHGIVSLIGVVVAGAIFALVTFAISLVTLPAMLDLRSSLVDSVGLSIKALNTNRGPGLLWALLITLLFGLSVLTAFIALIVIFPWLGLAMWHGYRDMVSQDWDRSGEEEVWPPVDRA